MTTAATTNTRKKTFSMQHTVPRLPIPSLEESCALYLQSLRPLLSPDEYQKSATLVQDFVNSDLGKSLQQRLADIDQASPYNWLEDNFWLRKAYLEWRDPLMVNSNWYMLGVNDPNHPQELLTTNGGVLPKGEFTHFQIHRAAHLIHRGLEYKEILENEDIPADMIRGNKAQCMWQHTRIFCLTRIPMHHCDKLVQYDMASTKHIIVLVRDQVYKLPVYKQQPGTTTWTLLTRQEIEHALLAIVCHVQRMDTRQLQPPIGLLTSWDRDNWAVARNHLLALDTSNKATNQDIESSFFAVALDDYSNGADMGGRTKMAFCGNLGIGNGHNRWYDKSITVLVESNGQCVYTGEHSPADALLVSYVFDHMLIEPCPPPFDIRPVTPDAVQDASCFEHLTWKVDPVIEKCLENAQKAADDTAAFSDSYVEVFEDYGTDWIKKVAKLPPDAFYQMTIQLAYHRIHGKVAPTYETASTRQFLHGRTDTIRTCSVQSKRLCEEWMNEQNDAKTKYDLLKDAINVHRKYTQISSNGHGCDRHLMVLRLLNMDHQIVSPTTGKLVPAPMHPMFEDPIFSKSQTWVLSTSNLHSGVRLMGTGFGSAVKDGYGVNYMAAPTVVKFTIEVKQVPDTVSAKEFGATLRRVLLELKDVCEKVHQSTSSTTVQARM